jgi:hypothetical protein
VLAVGFLFASLSAYAVDQEICPRYPVETIDSGLGVDFEDYYALNDELWPYWKARGIAYQVLHPETLAVLQQGYSSNSNGCFTLPDNQVPDSQSAIVVLYLDALLLDHIRVRARTGNFSNCDDDPFADHSDEPEYCQPLACMVIVNGLSGTQQKYVDFTCSVPEVTLQALASFPAYWWHHFDPLSVDFDFTITVLHRNGCSSGPSCSNAGFTNGDNLEILVNIDDQTEDKFRQKFLVGHEVGHAAELAYQHDKFGTEEYLYGGYDLLGGGPACGSAGEAHALTSLEYTSDGIMEGFAHFLSADAYNDHNSDAGRFTYYKNALGFPRDIPLEGASAFNMVHPHLSNRFAERVCDPVPQNAGTELDWLRFFWDLHTADASPDDQHQTLLKLRVDAAFLGTTWSAQNGYELLEENVCAGAAAVQALQTDFLSFAGSNDIIGGNGIEPTGNGPGCN